MRYADSPKPSLVRYESGVKEVEWLTESERRRWSASAEVACIVAQETTGELYAYMGGVKYDEHGDVVGDHDERAGRNGWIG